MSTLVAILVDGIIYASWLFVIAAGLTIIYRVMRILNMAHGSHEEHARVIRWTREASAQVGRPIAAFAQTSITACRASAFPGKLCC